MALSQKPVLLHGRVERLAWESDFFGLSSAIVRFSDSAPCLDAVELQRFTRVQAKVSAERSEWLDALQQLGFRLVEGEIDLSLTPAGGSAIPHLSVAGEADIPALRDMASQSFMQSRFRSPWYGPMDSGRLYAQWVENAVKGTFDHQCLVVREGRRLHGFVTLRQLNEKEARIGLLAGPGYGARLMQGAQAWCAARGLGRLWVATQMANRAALRRYIRSGATIESAAYWLYR
ncbi:dTDP-4-amino-4,6-dideoxy-D-galactose acyltransferase [Erwinia sp. CPCC 100877]|nr:dTDP-4-amino-4,6-dideoxy-D-galactose acyltransferase [Erwinia sp. CPCC 100877]